MCFKLNNNLCCPCKLQNYDLFPISTKSQQVNINECFQILYAGKIIIIFELLLSVCMQNVLYAYFLHYACFSIISCYIFYGPTGA